MHFFRFLILSVLVFRGFSLFAETAHQGVVGGPFHGYAQDDSGQVQVQVGPIADFAVPAGLAAKGTTLHIGIRDKQIQAEVVALPFL